MTKEQNKNLKLAFKELNNIGYFAKQNFWCCQSCGTNAIPADINKYVFYHNQDNDSLQRTGSTYLSWGGDANEIMSVFNKHDIKTYWNGNDDTRILITP